MRGKMIKHIMLSSFLLGGLSNLVYATDLRGHWEVVKIMNNYISSIACEADKVKVDDVIKIGETNEFGGATYYALWGGDIGCSGGSGTHSFYISEVSKFTDSRPLLVITNDALGDNNEEYWNTEKQSINYRFLKSMKKIDDKTLEIVSWDYADKKFGGSDGGNMGPANKFRYIVSYIDEQGWRITNQQLLEQNK